MAVIQLNEVLNEKQKKFCQEYLHDLNGKKAAIRAGYSARSAEVTASRLLSNDKVLLHLNELRKASEQLLDISRNKVLAEYAKIAFFDIRKILTVDGGLKQVSEIDDDSAAAIAGIESYEQKSGSIEPGDEGMIMNIGTVRKIKIADKKGALDSICKMLGYNAPDVVKNIVSLSDQSVEFS